MKAGWPKETLEEWVQKADQGTAISGFLDELKGRRNPDSYLIEAETMNPRLYGRTRFAWGRRRAGPTEPAPALPSVSYEQASGNKAKEYPLWHVYDTKEKSLEQNALRNRGKGTPLPAYPV
jgi:hypothetical protein